jgi:predicted ATPase/DNA-binding SARP family transcriptional activator
MIGVASASPPASAGGLALHIDVLGPPRVAWAGRSLTLTRRQTRALLYRLAASPHPAPRDQLAFLFWPDLPDAAARRNLVVLMNHLRRALPVPAALVAADDGVWLDRQAVRSDAVAVADSIAVALRDRRLDRLGAALDRIRGPFLEGFTLAGSDEFEAWAARERAGWERRRLEALEALVEGHAARGDHSAAVAAARRYLAADELAEAMHRRLIALYAAAGDRAAALRQFERCAAALARDLGVEPSAETRRVYEAARDGRLPPPETPIAGPAGPAWRVIDGTRRRDASPAADLPPLPVPPTPLIGRAGELAAARALLAGSDVRLVTLSGAGGAGKTRLALQVAWDLRGRFADGAAFVALAPLRDPALVVGAVAQACGVQQSGVAALDEVLRAYLRDKELLLVLDNCEHLLTATPAIAGLLAAAPRLRILATSRAALNLAGEHALPVPPLPTPDLARLPPVEALAEQPAVALLAARARATDPAFRLDAANAADLAAICARLDGLPLALELAAARLKLLTPRALLERLDHRLALLAGGPRDLPDRHRSLRAALDWSHQLLGAGEQRLFARLAVFAGGWTLAAAEAVCEGEGLSPAPPPSSSSLLDAMQALLEAHLIVRLGEANGEPRFGMLETVREYALERLDAAGQMETARRRHHAWCAALAAAAEPHLRGARQVDWLACLEAEHGNIRAALGWGLEHDPEATLGLATNTWLFWRLRGDNAEGRAWLERLLDAAPGAAALHARALHSLGMLAFAQGDLPAGRAWLEESLALGQALDCGVLNAVTLRELGVLVGLMGDAAESERLLDRGLALGRALGDPYALGANLGARGWLAMREGDYAAARGLLHEALAVLRVAGERLQTAFALRDLGRVALGEGDYAAAETFLQESDAIGRELGAGWHVAFVRWHLGNAVLARGDIERARAIFETGLTLARQAGHRDIVGYLLVGLGRAAYLRGEAAGAVDFLAEGLAIHEGQRNIQGQGPALQMLGQIAARQGDLPRALEFLGRSLTARRDAGDRLGVAASLEAMAMAGAPSAADRAARLLGAAAALRRAIGAPLEPVDRPAHAATMRALNARLGAADFAAARAAGAALTPEAAIAEAMAMSDRMAARCSVDDAGMVGDDLVGQGEDLRG